MLLKLGAILYGKKFWGPFVHAWARATRLGSLRVVHGPANDGDDNAMHAACAVRSLQGQMGACFYQERPALIDITRCAHS
jgi:hypothetical protein